ncbi:MAG: hypothetical protein EA414_08365 [Arthrospira sp. PLM2.Bin9]|nr:MAG: hypothetical protein EA414_08365 [Arthrospira sp. PLM2.Bin9]
MPHAGSAFGKTNQLGTVTHAQIAPDYMNIALNPLIQRSTMVYRKLNNSQIRRAGWKRLLVGTRNLRAQRFPYGQRLCGLDITIPRIDEPLQQESGA